MRESLRGAVEELARLRGRLRGLPDDELLSLGHELSHLVVLGAEVMAEALNEVLYRFVFGGA